MSDQEKVFAGLAIALGVLAITSIPQSNRACQSFFAPIASGAGQLVFAGAVGLVGAHLIA
jgi:hypothetical protein